MEEKTGVRHEQKEQPQPASFIDLLSDAVERRTALVEKGEIAELKELFRSFHASYKTLYNILHRKGLIQEDPYKNDKKISEICAPSNAPFLESERDTQMGIRLSEFESQLDFLTNYYQFAIDFLDMKRLKDLASLTTYIRWTALSVTSENMTSRVLADLMEKVKKGGDQMSVGLLNDAHEQLSQLQRRILGNIKVVSDLQRERYKLALRHDVFSRLPPEAQKGDPESEGALRTVKRQFAHAGENRPFYPELVQEVLREDRAPDAEKRRAELLASLKVEAKRPRKQNEAPELRQSLLEAVRSLSGISRNLEKCIEKLEDNNRLIQNRRLTLMQRIRRWAMKALGRSENKDTVEVRFVDVTTKATHTEKIDLNEFFEAARGKSRLFVNALSRTSTLTKKIETATDDQLLSFFGRNIAELRLLHRRLDSLDDYYKNAATGTESTQIRGIKIELTAIKNDIIRANQRHHEFVSRREEIEQLKRLGVDVNE